MSSPRATAPFKPKKITIEIPEYSRRVSGLLVSPKDAHALFVFGHGAGAGMNHRFMESMAQRIARRGIASLRYQFPYMEEGKRSPDQKPLLLATVRSAVRQARNADGSLPLLAGGKSMGGRMTSMAASDESLLGVQGIIFLGFPLHPPGSPSVQRAAHLSTVTVPMLFLQGTRDKLADLELLKPVVRKLGKRATLSVIEGGDHSFHVPRSAGMNDEDVLDVLADTAARWVADLKLRPPTPRR